MQERVICAAIWYKEQPTMFCKPRNVDKGTVIAGLRHPHCIAVMYALKGIRTVQFGPDSCGESIQGFITNIDRFVDRKEALIIAKQAGQLIDPTDIRGNELYSEDIY